MPRSRSRRVRRSGVRVGRTLQHRWAAVDRSGRRVQTPVQTPIGDAVLIGNTLVIMGNTVVVID